MGASSPKVAEMVEVDEKGRAVRGTRRTANTKNRDGRDGREGKERKTKSDVTPSVRALPMAGDVLLPEAPEVKTVQTAKFSRSATDKPHSERRSSRPPSVHRNVTFPSLDTDIPPSARSDPSYYGVSPSGTPVITQTATTARAVRPPPQPRPNSMYVGAPPVIYSSRPPQSKSAHYASPVTPFMPTSFRPVSPSTSYGSYFPFQPELSGRERLVQRLGGPDPLVRTTSASGNRELSDRDRAFIRSEREAEDARRMPPPGASYRRPGDVAVPYYDDDRAARALYRDVELPSRHRSMSRDATTFHYGHADERIRVTALESRRGSYDSDERRRSATYEDKMRDARRHQEETSGPTYNLTAEALRKSQRAGTSSRSTRSSGSRNESDYKRSTTTQTTRSGSGDADDVTIRFKGSGTVEVAGAKIQCEDGAELNLVRRKSVRGGSERSGSEYERPRIEDRRSRDGRATNHSRSGSTRRT